MVVCLSMNILTLIWLSGCCPPFCPGPDPPDNGDTQKPFALAYVDTNWQLRTRWSDNGTSWTPDVGGRSIDRAPGIAADRGAIYLGIFQDGVSDAKLMMGLPNVWDSTSRTVGDGHRGELDSGTSIAHVDGPNWLVAYVSQNRAKIVKFDSTATVRDFGAEVTPVPGVVNNNLIDRPAIVNRNGRLLVSWLMNNQLQMVTGDIEAGEPVWQPGYMFNANFAEQGFGQPIGAHDLAHDGQNFYAAVVRQRDPLPDEVISHYFLFIYTSNNGLNWTRVTSRESMNPQSMSIAARGPGDIIAILSRSMLNPTNAYRFNGSSWSVLNLDAIFGANPMNAGHDFTLFAAD
jgi:hypothetical protein